MRVSMSPTCLDEITAQPDIIALCALIARTKNITAWNAMIPEDKIKLIQEYLDIYKTIRAFIHDKV